MFFPSYSLLETMSSAWVGSGLLATLTGVKTVFLESKALKPEAFGALLAQFRYTQVFAVPASDGLHPPPAVMLLTR